MIKKGLTIKAGTKGIFDDGRIFTIKEIQQLFIYEDGSISNHFQKVVVDIDNILYYMSIEKLGQHINYDKTYKLDKIK